MVDSEVREAHDLLGVFLCRFFYSIAWDVFGFSQAKCKHLSYDRAAYSEGKDHFSSDERKAYPSLHNHNGTAHDGDILA